MNKDLLGLFFFPASLWSAIYGKPRQTPVRLWKGAASLSATRLQPRSNKQTGNSVDDVVAKGPPAVRQLPLQ